MRTPTKPSGRGAGASAPSGRLLAGRARRGVATRFTWRREHTLGALLVLFALACYWPIYGQAYHAVPGRPAENPGFIWDDEDYVFQNPHLPDPRGLERIWFHKEESPQYYPLVFTSLWLEYRLWGGPDAQGNLKPNGYHFTNVLLHGLNALLIWLVLRRVGLRWAWAVAALFAVHPFCVESVAWVTERKNVLSLFFYLLAALALLRWEEEGDAHAGRASTGPEHGAARAGARAFAGAGRWIWWAIGAGLFLLGLFSKTVIASLPIALLILRWWRRSPITRAYLIGLAPLLLLGFLMGRMTASHERELVLWGDVGPYWDLSVLDRILIAGRALWFYVGKILWPHPLVFNYRRWEIDAASLGQWIWPLLVLAALAALLWLARRRGQRGPLAAGLFYAVTLFPALGFVNVAPMRFSFVADHFAYLASLGVIAAATAAVAAALARWLGPGRAPRAAMMVLAAIVVVLGALTWSQTRIYRDVEKLYRHTIEHYPESHLARINLAAILRRRGDLDEARQHYERVLADWPDWPWTRARALAGLGNLEQQAGGLAEAERLFREASELTPAAPEPRYNLGNVLLLLGRSQEARAAYERVLEQMPSHFQARYNLAYALEQLGDYARAEGHYQRVTRESPGFALGWTGLARLEQRKGQPARAVDYYRRARQLDPGSSGAVLGEMEALFQAGRRSEGHAIAQALLAPGQGGRAPAGQGPDPALAFEVVRRMRGAGAHAEAVRALRTILATRPDDARMKMMLAEELAAAPDPAVRDGEEALGLALGLEIQLGPEDPALLALLGIAYAEQGRFAEAASALRRGGEIARARGLTDLAAVIAEREAAAAAGRAWRLP